MRRSQRPLHSARGAGAVKLCRAQGARGSGPKRLPSGGTAFYRSWLSSRFMPPPGPVVSISIPCPYTKGDPPLAHILPRLAGECRRAADTTDPVHPDIRRELTANLVAQPKPQIEVVES